MTDFSVRSGTINPAPSMRRNLDRIEVILIGMLAGVTLTCILLAIAKEQAVAWSAFGWSLSPSLGLFAVGLYIRTKLKHPNIAHFAIAVSLYIGFSGMAALLIYLRFPIHGPLMDSQLEAIDAHFGYFWPDFVSATAAYSFAARMLGIIYKTSLAQIFILIAFLALSGRILNLHRALLAGSISLLLTTVIWSISPSIGPAAFHVIPMETAESINLFTDAKYGALLRNLVDNGVPVITPSVIVGTIAFPSFHTVMAGLVVWYLRGTPLFLPALLVNLLMLPAILVHGGHYLTDVAGGFATFAISAWFSFFLTRNQSLNI